MDAKALDALVRTFLAEDVGSGDVTTAATVPAGTRARARVTQKQDGVISGLEVAAATFLATDPHARVTLLCADGDARAAPAPVLEIDGSAPGILEAERTALNLLQRLSGIATLTAQYVRAVEGTGARILDTRKTTPGLRLLEKQAVVDGGGHNHRIGLYDMVLIKENHIAAAGGVRQAIAAARAHAPGLPLECEVRDLSELSEALEAQAPRVLLDNMAPDQLRAAVALVDGKAETEASGGVNLQSIREIAQTGVTYVSVGALTHSAPALDLSLILERLP
jgi:nicotinate-nucleotide pyrophosphorylase (carboxylating)